MALSREVRRLKAKWDSQSGWPKRLDWLEIYGLRGWHGQRVDLSKFPIIAIAGENGSGKSTIIQSAASVYRSDTAKFSRFASEFFPSTAWDKITKARIRFGYREGGQIGEGDVRKPTSRWLGNPDRRIRPVEYIDLSRVQPVANRVGYTKIAKSMHTEVSAETFEENRLARLSQVLGRKYTSAKLALSNVDPERKVPVLAKSKISYSGFHQGQGETTITELLMADLPKNGLVVIDEIESSLHPRSQRWLIRDLAEQCRLREMQILLTTHSPYILEELPLEARLQIIETSGEKQVVVGISSEFSMTMMDEKHHPECDIYVEDDPSRTFLTEILSKTAPSLLVRCQIIPCGAASVCRSLGEMVETGKFVKPTCVFLDGDTDKMPGCIVLPGGDAPERVVFEQLQAKNWGDLWLQIARDVAQVSDACSRAMTITNHHDWPNAAANSLMIGGQRLWESMSIEWCKICLNDEDGREMADAVQDTLTSYGR